MLELARWWMRPNLRSQMYRYVLPVSAILTQIHSYKHIATQLQGCGWKPSNHRKRDQLPDISNHCKRSPSGSWNACMHAQAQTLLSWNVQSMKICVYISHCVSACVSRISGKAGPSPAPGEVVTRRRCSVCVWVQCLLASCSRASR